jgi:hypothetical protein
MLNERDFKNTRLWPRGVDLNVFAPAKRFHHIRKSYGVPYSLTTGASTDVPTLQATSAVGEESSHSDTSSVVVLSVGRLYVVFH